MSDPQTVMPAAPGSSREGDDRPVLLREDAEGIATLTLNRPDARNALSEALLAALHEKIDACAGDDAVRVVIVAAAGPAFCAGHDLRELTARRADADAGRAYFARLMDQCSAMMQAVVACPKPVIACVHGPASAAGCQLVASCDLAFAGDRASFTTPGVNIGLFCSTPMVALSRNVAPKHAMEMLLTGEPVSADDARRIGLVNRVVPGDRLVDTTRALARKIAGKSRRTLAIGKQAFYRQAEMSLAEAYRYASEVMVRNMLTEDASEGIGAFLDKREPRWRDE